jgi:putative ABC transport system permease protein
MTNHHLKLATKSLLKNKYYTLINLVGLAAGMLSALIIAKYIGASLQFDSFHLKRNRIYTLAQEEFLEGNLQKKGTATYLGVADLISQMPEVADVTRYYQHVESLVISERESGDVVSFTEKTIFIADSSFFKIFTFPFVQGNESGALYNGKAIALSRSASVKYFGLSDAIGKTLTVRTPWGKETSYQVIGIVKDIPKFSRFKFDFLIFHAERSPDELWNLAEYSTYLLLKGKSDAGLLEGKLAQALKNVPQLKEADTSVTISLQSFSDVELSVTDYLLVIVGIFIVLITWINYINQVVAQSYWRIKEVAVLRIMGASQTDLKLQFVIESFITCFVAMVLVIMMFLGLEPYLQLMTNEHLLPLIGDPTSINLILVGAFTAGALVAATVPAIILLSQNFGAGLRNIYSMKIGSVGLRKALVIFQFSVSTVLMISIFVISGQLKFLRVKDKGIDLKNVMVIKSPMAKDTTWNAKRKMLQLFKERCAEIPMVVGVTSSTTVPGEEYRHETFLSFEGNNGKTLVHQNGVDEHFFALYRAELVAGHDFIPDARARNRASIILNETAAKALGISDYEKAINSKIIDHEEPDVSLELIGIVKDYHQTSVKYELRPMAFKYNLQRGHCSLKIRASESNDTEFSEALGTINKIWRESYPDASFDYFFLDESFAAQDSDDRYFGTFFKYFTVLSVVISCLGLFGLSLLISTKRQREIGVRKVFGATTLDILAIFLKGYLGTLTISIIVGSPLAYLLMKMWLTNYAYRIEIGFGLVSMAIFSLTLIFVFTVCFHTIGSSLANPARILRD